MIGQEISGHYRVTEELGRGGMGVVYRARDSMLERDVAVKVLPPAAARNAEDKERFLREARAASSFDHPNICTVHEVGETDEGELYLVMPVYEGGTLRDRMDRGPLKTEEAIHFATQIAAGLGRAHREGIVHRDIKPDNLMVLDDDRVVILDFGVAKLAEGLDLTKHGSTVGTASYMSPEQAQGMEVDGRSDLWALGVILYEMLSATRPFPGGYDQAVIYGILNSEPEPLSGVSQPLEGVVTRLLSKAVDARFETGEAVIEALQSGLKGQEASPETTAARGTWRMAAAVVATAAVVGLGMFALSRLSGPAPIRPDPALAVLPFQVQGSPDLAYLGDGIPTLLSTAIDGMGDLRAVDPLAIASFLSDRPVDVEMAQAVARRFSAEGVVLGSVSQLGDEIRLSATVYAPDGVPGETRTTTASTQAALPAALDELARSLIAGRFAGKGQSLAGLSALTSHSFEGLRAYLVGESQARSARWGDAYDSFSRAIELDSTFALALYRRASLVGWPDVTDQTEESDILAAKRHSAGLPSRVRLTIDAQYAATLDSNATSRRRWTEITDRFPDDAHAFFRLAERVFHYNRYLGRSDREAIPLFRRALELDSSNVEVRTHLMDFAIRDANWEWADSLFGPLEEIASVHAAMVRAFGRSNGTVDGFFEQLQTVKPSSWDEVLMLGLIAREPETSIRGLDSLLVREPESEYVPMWKSAHHRDLVLLGRMHEAVNALESARGHTWFWAANPMTYLGRDHVTVDASGLQDLAPWSSWDGYLAQHIALDALHRDDMATVQAALDTMVTVNSPTSRFYARSVETLLAWAAGDFAAALVLAETSEAISREGVTIELGRQSSHVWPRWLRAELLFEAQRYDEAAKWYETMHHMDPSPGPAEAIYAAPAHRRLAEIAEIQGDPDEAIRQYEMFLRYWYDVDPELQPVVDEAKTRLGVLLAARAAGGDVS